MKKWYSLLTLLLIFLLPVFALGDLSNKQLENLVMSQAAKKIDKTAIVKTLGNPSGDNTIPSEKAVRRAVGRFLNMSSLPPSSVDSQVVIFKGSTGKMLKAAQGTGLAKLTSGVLGYGVAGTDYLHPSGSAALLTGFPTLNQNTTGSAAKLTTPRTINGVNFDGSANITIADPTKEPTIAIGTSAQYWRGDKSMQQLNAGAIQSTVPTAFTPVAHSITTSGSPVYAGKYYRIGSLVYFQIYITGATTLATTGNTSYFSGLPIAAVSSHVGQWSTSTVSSLGSVFISSSNVYLPTASITYDSYISGTYLVQ